MDDKGRSFAQPYTGSETVRATWAGFRMQNLHPHPVTVLRALATSQRPLHTAALADEHSTQVELLRQVGAVAREDFWHGDVAGGRMVPHITPAGFDLIAVTNGLVDPTDVPGPSSGTQ